MYGICICGHQEEYHQERVYVDPDVGLETLAKMVSGVLKPTYRRMFCQQTSWCWCIEYREKKLLTHLEEK